MSDYWKEHTPLCGVKEGETLDKTIKKFVDHGFPFGAFIAQAVNEYAKQVLEQAEEMREEQAKKEAEGKFAIVNCEIWICAARSWQAVNDKRKEKKE